MNTTLDVPDATGTRVACKTVAASKHYLSGANEVRALDGVDISFQAGMFTSIMGPSGSGKSTLMHCMAGLETLTAGKAWIGETCLSDMDEAALTEVRRDRVGFVFQAFNLIPTLTVLENIELPFRLGGGKPDHAWLTHISQLLGLANRLDHKPSELSGGQQQRVAVARALAGNPDIVFADEPTGNLDSASGADVLGILRDAVTDMGQTVVMVTHDPIAASYSDRVVYLRDGRVAGDQLNPTAETILLSMRSHAGASLERGQ